MRNDNVNKKSLNLVINVNTLISMAEKIIRVDNRGYLSGRFGKSSGNLNEFFSVNSVGDERDLKSPCIELTDFDRYNYWVDSSKKSSVIIDAYSDMLERYIAHLLSTGSIDVIQDFTSKYNGDPLLAFEEVVNEIKNRGIIW